MIESIPVHDYRFCPECDGSATTGHASDCSVEIMTTEAARRTDEELDGFLSSAQMAAFAAAWVRQIESLHRLTAS